VPTNSEREWKLASSSIIDVRNPRAWAEATDMAAGAIRVALDDAGEAIARIPRSKPIVTYCT